MVTDTERRESGGGRMSWTVESPRYPFGWVRPPKELALTDDRGGRIVYVPERTCQMIDNGCELCCSECDGRHEYDSEPNYCSVCDAKVVDE